MSAFGITDSNLDFDNHDNKKEAMITSTQASIIEGLLHQSSIAEKTKERIELEIASMTEKRAYECIAYLEENKVDAITSGHNYTQTDIKNKLKTIK
jgi:hypothetical protein